MTRRHTYSTTSWHLARARDQGATIAQEIETYGYTSYVARDREGHTWRFAEARPTQPR